MHNIIVVHNYIVVTYILVNIDTKIFHVKPTWFLESFWSMPSYVVNKMTWAPHEIASIILFLDMSHDRMRYTYIDTCIVDTKSHAVGPLYVIFLQDWIYLRKYSSSSTVITCLVELSYIVTVRGLGFSTSVSFDSSTKRLNGFTCISSTKEAVHCMCGERGTRV